MKNSRHRDRAKLGSIDRRNLGDRLPAKAKAVKFGDTGQADKVGPNNAPGNAWPKGYSQTFKAGKGVKYSAPEVLGAEYLEYKAPDPKSECIHLDRVGGFQFSVVIDGLNPQTVPVLAVSTHPHLNRSRNRKMVSKTVAKTGREEGSAVATVRMVENHRRLKGEQR